MLVLEDMSLRFAQRNWDKKQQSVEVSGTPEQVAACSQSYTGKFLAPLLKRDRERQAQLDAQ